MGKPLTTDQLLHSRRQILEAAERHGAIRIRIFGSVARGEAREDSDLDVLVAMGAGRSLLDLVALEQDLEELLGRRVQVVSEGGLSPYLKDRILHEAVAL